jgi:hypothetical protein
MSVEAESKTQLTTRRQNRRGRRNQEISAVFNFANEPMAGRIPRPPDNQVYRICASGVLQAFHQTSASVEVDNATAFSLASVPSGFGRDFDQYRIDFIECWFAPRVTQQTSASANMGVMASVVDYDNATGTSLAALELFNNVILGSGQLGRYHAWKPHAANAFVRTGGSTANVGNVQSPWLDTATTDIAHFGFKSASTVTDVVYIWDLYYRLHVSFRNSV